MGNQSNINIWQHATTLEKLMETGHYGMKSELCACFLVHHSGNSELLVWKDEESAVEDLILALTRGFVTTPLIYSYWKDAKDETHAKEIMKQLNNEFSDEVKDWVRACIEQQNIPSQVELHILLHKACKELGPIMAAQLIQYAFALRKINESQLMELQHLYVFDDTKLAKPKTYGGFGAWLPNETVRYYNDSNVPNVYRKKIQCIAEGKTVTPFMMYDYSREDLGERLKIDRIISHEISNTLKQVSDAIMEAPTIPLSDDLIAEGTRLMKESMTEREKTIRFLRTIWKAQ